MLMNFYISYIFTGIVFLIASIILLKKGIKLKSKNTCEECGNILNGEKVCSKCGNPIKDNEKLKNIFLISGGACGIICLYNFIRFFAIIFNIVFKIGI